MTATFPCSGFAPDSLILHAAKRAGHDAAYEFFLFLLYRYAEKSQLLRGITAHPGTNRPGMLFAFAPSFFARMMYISVICSPPFRAMQATALLSVA